MDRTAVTSSSSACHNSSKQSTQTDICEAQSTPDTEDLMPDDEFSLSQTFKLGSTDDNVIAYLAGYAMKKMNDRLVCNSCKEAYENARVQSQGELYECDSSHLTFIRNKTFDWAKHGLLSPSQEMYSLCSNVEKVVQMNIEKLSSGRNIMQNLKDCVCAVLDLRTFKIGSVSDEHLQQQSE